MEKTRQQMALEVLRFVGGENTMVQVSEETTIDCNNIITDQVSIYTDGKIFTGAKFSLAFLKLKEEYKR